MNDKTKRLILTNCSAFNIMAYPILSLWATIHGKAGLIPSIAVFTIYILSGYFIYNGLIYIQESKGDNKWPTH